MKSVMPESIPTNSILGINYSGMHDTAIAVTAPDGSPIFACSLERLSRVKQDGRPPFALLEKMPWDRIAKIAISTDQYFSFPANYESKLLATPLPQVREAGLVHEEPFYDFIKSLPAEKVFVCHQMAHAASAFWASGFESALCLTYDGGMCNSPWFGGLYLCDREKGIQALDQFSALHYAKITSLYTFVTGLLGFSPNKHEGKITGLAAYGKASDACRYFLKNLFDADFLSIESTVEWSSVYSVDQVPALNVREGKMDVYRQAAEAFTKEELAATVQEMAEQHILEILDRAKKNGWTSENICLAGGLFANVKINQRVVESGFSKLFVAPPMTDDGTALGAAWHALVGQAQFEPQKIKSMYLGPSYDPREIETLLTNECIEFERLPNAAETLSDLLSEDQVVAIFQGGMEFGPRSLGNRSIIAQATKSDINQSLNDRLNRTEFMPFAPITRIEDAQDCYLDIDKVLHTAEFMTVTVNCTSTMINACPAVVHVDGTARPQLVRPESNPLIHAILTSYLKKTNRPSLVNTSFNIHEEPIVCSPKDALHGFFESGLDYLYLEGGYLVAFKNNTHVALKYLQEKIKSPSQKSLHQAATITLQDKKLAEFEAQLVEKERIIQEQNAQLINYRQELGQHAGALRAYHLAYGGLSPFAPIARLVRAFYNVIRPRLGQLSQYSPRPMSCLASPCISKLSAYPCISIVTPSYQQGEYIERTIKSVVDQAYPNLRYFVQDGGSKDSTTIVLRRYENALSGWVSEKDSGQSQAINRGFNQLNGEIMAWLNSDDLLLPGALHIVADYFNRHPEVDVVYGNRLLIDVNDMEIGRWILPGHDSAILSWVDYVPQETLFWRRRIWEKAGGKIDESFRFAMDWDLLVRFRDAGAKFGHIPQFLGAFRIHEHQKTSAAISQIGYQEMGRIRERTLGYLPECKQIRKAVLPYLLKHIFVDMIYRLKTRFGIKA
ncbi:carbamoyltransferase C-terminal domain-containing protein [Methylophilus sp. VKM B-3414]|uniref:carbamoyltransferase C-terminal domain-containing protein n=1 Tax=Methylophilus sp. VKM B-3414 TaxID=3076121 RepID=UPI0028D2AA44|nr:carbamoyltransferase C-terminal domain-containing protein [Methylophilus sp. VKM B-3414]